MADPVPLPVIPADAEAAQDLLDQESSFFGGVLPGAQENSQGSSLPEPRTSPAFFAPVNGDYVFDNDNVPVRQPFSKNLFGANLDVVSSLAQIQFESGVDGSLRNAVAYIIPWRRRGVSNRTVSSTSPSSVPTDNSVNEVLATSWNNPAEVIDAGIDFDPSLLSNTEGLSAFPVWDQERSGWVPKPLNFSSSTFTDDTKGKIFSSDLYNRFSLGSDGETINTDPSGAQNKQKALQADIALGARQSARLGASLSIDALLRDNPDAQRLATAGVDTVLDFFGKAPSGPVYVGNTIGSLVNQAGGLLNSFGVSVPPGLQTSIRPDLSSKISKGNSLSLSPGENFGEGAWQFLFNPSQLALSVGPSFKKAETWAVFDEANAGQPLHWTGHKNPELKFSKVLLNGYIFGKQVEELEQGLIKLFMENIGQNQPQGPQVLEFVWGRKSFGPCVIKDIRVNQKMWDEGLLVNAEVDFTLERIPEWTINDGQVRVYNPAGEPSIQPLPVSTRDEDPSAPREEPEPEREEPEPEAEQEPEPENRGPVITANEKAAGKKTAANFKQLAENPDLNTSVFAKIGDVITQKKDKALKKYDNIFNSFASVLGPLDGLAKPCKQKCRYPGETGIKNNKVLGCVKSCSEQAAQLLEDRYK